MKKTSTAKLTLNRQTIATLTTDGLSNAVVGGVRSFPFGRIPTLLTLCNQCEPPPHAPAPQPHQQG